MFDALKDRGNAVAMKIYPNEAHGFRRAETIRDAWSSELAFYGRVWDMDVDVESDIDIANL